MLALADQLEVMLILAGAFVLGVWFLLLLCGAAIMLTDAVWARRAVERQREREIEARLFPRASADVTPYGPPRDRHPAPRRHRAA